MPQTNRQPTGGADDGRAALRLFTGWVKLRKKPYNAPYNASYCAF